MDDVLKPGVVGIAGRWSTKLPSWIFAEAVAAPVGDIEGWIGENEVKLLVAELVLVEGALVVPLDVGVDPADGEVHPAQAPGRVVAFLAPDRNIANAPAVLLNKRSDWTNMPPEPQHGS